MIVFVFFCGLVTVALSALTSTNRGPLGCCAIALWFVGISIMGAAACAGAIGGL